MHDKVVQAVLTVRNINNWGTFNSSFQPASESSNICVDTWISWKSTTNTEWDDSIKFWVVTEGWHTNERSTTRNTIIFSYSGILERSVKPEEIIHIQRITDIFERKRLLKSKTMENRDCIYFLTYLLGKHQLVLLYTLRINVDRLWC